MQNKGPAMQWVYSLVSPKTEILIIKGITESINCC